MRFTNEQLRQSTFWPSQSQGVDVAIHSMAPQYAFHSWCKLKAEYAHSEWELVGRFSPLAMALLDQAMGGAVVYADTLPMADLFQEEELLERVYDGLKQVEQTGTTHPIRSARIITQHIKRKETE